MQTNFVMCQKNCLNEADKQKKCEQASYKGDGICDNGVRVLSLKHGGSFLRQSREQSCTERILLLMMSVHARRTGDGIRERVHPT